MSKFDRESEAGRIVATVAAVEVMRCMCGSVPCRHCGGSLRSSCGSTMPTHCARCGCPVAEPINP